MFLFMLFRVFILLVLIETALSLIITSVYAGRKKFKTYSFDYLLPPIVIEKPHKLQMSYNGHWSMRKPNFKIKFNMPIKLPLHLHYGDNYEEADTHDVDNSGNSVNNNYDADGQNGDANYDQEDDQTYHDSGDSPSYEDDQDQSNDNNNYSKPKQLFQFKANESPSISLKGNINMNPPPPLPPSHHYDHDNYASNNYRKIQLGEKTPYTGKAQVSSFIDNGHLINAQHQSGLIASNLAPIKGVNGGGLTDAMFGDQLDASYGSSKNIINNAAHQGVAGINVLSNNLQLIGKKSEPINREDIRRSKAHAAMKLLALKKMKMVKVPLLAKKLVLKDAKSHIHTVRLGYKLTPPEISYITTYENVPDAVPLSVPVSALSRYYTSLSFTNGLKAIPYDPADFGPFGTIKWLAKLGTAPKLLLPLKAAKMIKYKG